MKVEGIEEGDIVSGLDQYGRVAYTGIVEFENEEFRIFVPSLSSDTYKYRTKPLRGINYRFEGTIYALLKKAREVWV